MCCRFPKKLTVWNRYISEQEQRLPSNSKTLQFSAYLVRYSAKFKNLSRGCILCLVKRSSFQSMFILAFAWILLSTTFWIGMSKTHLPFNPQATILVQVMGFTMHNSLSLDLIFSYFPSGCASNPNKILVDLFIMYSIPDLMIYHNLRDAKNTVDIGQICWKTD